MENKYFEAPTIYVGEVNINVTNLDKSLMFYQDIFGFDVLKKTTDKVVLTADGEKPLLTLEQPKNVISKQKRTSGLYHFAILLPNRSSLSEFLRHLVQSYGSQIQLGASDHDVSEALYFQDPDGNGIEVAHDRPSTEWGWNGKEVNMGTAALDAEGLLAESTKAWTGVPKETLIGHIHLHVSDLIETEEFYVKGLGFDIVTRYPGALFASHNGYHHHLGLNVWNGSGVPAPPKNSVGLNWFTLVFPDGQTRLETINRLEKIGATITQENNWYTTKDPAGNIIRLTVN